MKNKNFKSIGVIGLGYVGLPLAVEFAAKGIKVFGVERNLNRVNSVNKGVSYIEDISQDRIRQVVDEDFLSASTDFDKLKNTDAVIICVPTPLTKNKAPDIHYIKDVTKAMLPHLKEDVLVVLESTTYPGTTEEVVLPILKESSLNRFYLAFSPERVDPGNKEYPLSRIPKIVGGINQESTELAYKLYSMVFPSVFKASSPKVAELAKLLENTFRLVNIALVDELAMFCEKANINVWEVIDAAKTKPYGFIPFYPGPGIGGHCIPIDPFYLQWKAKEYDVDISFIEIAGRVNDSMPEYLVNKISYALNSMKKSINGSKILILGTAYKKDVGDTRESPAYEVISRLGKWGANVEYFDPFVKEIKVAGKTYYTLAQLTEKEISEADCVVILTAHSTIDYDMVAKNGKLIVDSRNAIKKESSKIFRLGDGRND